MTDIDSAVFSIVNQGKIVPADFEDFLLPSTTLDGGALNWHSTSAFLSDPFEWNVSVGHKTMLTEQLPATTCNDAFEIGEIFKDFEESDGSWTSSEHNQSPSPSHQDLNRSTSSVSSKSDATSGSAPRWGKPRTRRNKKPGFWTRQEHEKFLAGLEQFGMKEYLGTGGADLLAMFMGTRTATQVKSHAQKHFHLAKQGIDSRTLFMSDN
mmetsp:Transcript_115482/g.172546  ORF Transcript_115482/g.172546 Transcript_115482/m.172546 type:complete len:209 (-) Transcript_115482:81-707(-)